MGFNFGGNSLSKRFTGVGMVIMILLLLASSTKFLKIEDEEGTLLYDDRSNRSMEVVEYQSNSSRTIDEDLRDIVKIAGKEVGKILPKMHDENVPGKNAQLAEEIDELSDEMKEVRELYSGEKEKIEEVRRNQEILWRDMKEVTDKEKKIRNLGWNPNSIECLIDAHEETVFQGIGLKCYENIFRD